MNFKVLESSQKLRGGYYTHPDIADFLTKWVLSGGCREILEPSCGDGVFLDSVARLKGRRKARVVACELNPQEARKARSRVTALSSKLFSAEIFEGDFLQWSIDRFSAGPKFDAVVGNPPFVRYQYLEKEQQARAELLFRHFGLGFTKHTNAWVPFVIASVAHLRPGGRLGMVVPAELLHVLHATSLRHFLIQECSKIVVLDPTDILFSETLQGVVLLMAQKSSKESRGEVSIVPVRRREMLNGDGADLYEKAKALPASTFNGKWMVGLLSERERQLLEELGRCQHVRKFKDVGSVDVGIVTGANKFFLVPDSVVKQYGLESWVHPMFGRSEHVSGVVYDKKVHERNRHLGLPTNFVWLVGISERDLPTSVREYIKMGETEKLHERYKCRIREPWYCVPSVYTTPVGMLKRSHNFPRLIFNKIRAYTTDTAYRINTTGVKPSDFVVSFVNSLTALTSELEGRHYGGGVLELVPSEIEKVLVPMGRFDDSAITALDSVLRKGLPAEEVLARQDEVVLKQLGLPSSSQDELRNAWMRLRSRRQRLISAPVV